MAGHRRLQRCLSGDLSVHTQSDDALDAVVCAPIHHAAHLGLPRTSSHPSAVPDRALNSSPTRLLLTSQTCRVADDGVSVDHRRTVLS
jgi:hypothetical protein